MILRGRVKEGFKSRIRFAKLPQETPSFVASNTFANVNVE